ncbi:PQ loop repeat-domain-containing protein [Kickxella alabastrina]|uniref:PQ loop repeat-domain-containing protein n=1 Tax=Kickxella alabastrina TaxID=61397 RepID=UPI002220F3F3|nr:PQ loop repeat-domain-containing protein [Kickxella alabastrina]KAI7828282.1 PQ loop repeat-domain-containing protein [Kickxella alabastrina]
MDSNSSLVLLSSVGSSISTVLGWTYFVAWSVSFYPQIILNYRRKSVEGLSIDFLIYNVYGFACYALFNTAFYFSKSIQDEYSHRNNGHSHLVRANDLFFSYHALLLSLTTFLQSLYYKRTSTQRASTVSISYFLLTLTGLLVLLACGSGGDAAAGVGGKWGVYEVVLVKYVPQIWLNYCRQSTVGWSVHNILLDFTGGCLSFVQLFLDAIREGDVGGVWGNPVGFDLVFLVQHYVLYTERYDPKDIESQLRYRQVTNYGSAENSENEDI